MQIQNFGGDQDRVAALQELLLSLDQVDVQTSHVVHGGICSRTIFIPAGTVLVGARTLKDHVCIVCGDISVTTDEGPQRLTGYHAFAVGAGHKRVGQAHADTYWTTIWRTDLTDVSAIEDEMTLESELLQTRRQGLTFSSKNHLEG